MEYARNDMSYNLWLFEMTYDDTYDIYDVWTVSCDVVS